MFPIDDFKAVAIELPIVKFKNKNNIISAVHRTAIGRYYYYIFLKYRERLRDVLISEDKIELDNPSINHHKLIQLTLKYYDKTDIGIAEYFSELRHLRNDCDYDLSRFIDEENINDAKIIVGLLENKLNSIKSGNDLNEAFAKALTALSPMKPIIKPK